MDSINEFYRRERFPVASAVREYILRTTLTDPTDFQSGFNTGKFVTSEVRSLLVEALAASKEAAVGRGLGEIDVFAAEVGFERIIDAKYRCPYPFIIC
jgi:hypothetical protein